jgi:hypothetical protein
MKNSSMGSRKNPLKSFKWISLPEFKPIPSKLLSLEPIKSMKGQALQSGVLRLTFDIGIIMKIEAIAQTLQHRRKRKLSRNEKFGWGGQFAFHHYLDFFVDWSPFRFQPDDPFSSRFSKPADFVIFPDWAKCFSIEIKTAPPNSSKIHYFKNDPNPYPNYFVAVEAVSMNVYEVFGYMLGSEVEKSKSTLYRGLTTHSFYLNHEVFRPYSDFHQNVLRLPLLDEFDNEHYV